MDEFDYVVVGGGSAGCVVASRLSENPDTKVCLLEAGKTGEGWIVNTPVATALMLPSTINNWAFETVPQPGLNGRKGYQPRGKALGGSSAINAMIYIRGHKWDYDHWASLGNKGWSYEDVLPYFKRSENNEDLRDGISRCRRPIERRRASHRQSRSLIFSLRRQASANFRSTNDFNGAEQEGVGLYQVTQKNGERWSAARAYMHTAPRAAEPVGDHPARWRARSFSSQAARPACDIGEGRSRDGEGAAREVIVASGALQSPQLLMLSGIGEGDRSCANLASRSCTIFRRRP